VPFLLILIAFIVMGRLNAKSCSLICNLRIHKGWGSTQMIKEFSNKMWKRRAVDYLIKKIDLDGTTARKPGSGRPKSARTTENVEIVSELIRSQEDTPQSHLSPREIAQHWHIVHQCILNIACKLISTMLCD